MNAFLVNPYQVFKRKAAVYVAEESAGYNERSKVASSSSLSERDYVNDPS